MRLLRTALGNGGIARLEAGWAVASLGAWTFSIALALYAYYEDGPGGVALAVAVRMLPAALFAPFGTRIADLYPRRTIVIGSALLRFALLEAIALVVSVEAPFELLLTLAAAYEIASSLHRPARAALLIELARTPAELAAAGAGRAVDYAGFLAGALAAGVLVSTGGLDNAFAVAGLAFLAVAAIGWGLPAGTRIARPAAGREPLSFEPIADAVRTVARHPWTRVRVGLFGASVLVQSMLELLLVVAALDLLGMGSGGVGWLRAALAAGGLLGGAAAVVLLGRGRLAAGLLAGLTFAGVPLALVPAWPETVPVLVLLVLLGGGYALVEAALLLLTQRLAPAELLTQVVGAEELVYPIARAVGTGLAAWLVVGLGDKETLVVAGLLLPAIAIVSLRALGRAERGAPVPDRAFRLLGGVPAFAGLPRATIENLALCAVPARFAAGDTIVAEGRDEACFHVIDAGTVEVRGDDGSTAVRLEEGDCFGEGALLRGAPCTSSVMAVTPVETLTIGRADFRCRVSPPARSSPPAAVAPDELRAPAVVAG